MILIMLLIITITTGIYLMFYSTIVVDIIIYLILSIYKLHHLLTILQLHIATVVINVIVVTDHIIKYLTFEYLNVI